MRTRCTSLWQFLKVIFTELFQPMFKKVPFLVSDLKKIIFCLRKFDEIYITQNTIYDLGFWAFKNDRPPDKRVAWMSYLYRNNLRRSNFWSEAYSF